jgi:hypothetical protein
MSHHHRGNAYPYHHPHHGRTYIEVHDHDVLSGRGVNIAQHPGNERFRALIQSRYDTDYCLNYTATEKKAVAEEIIAHIQALDPPGRFLKRPNRSKNTRGLTGPWEELSYREAVKKSCQALRDCNRPDRTGYAAAVEVPEDVKLSAEQRSQLGLSNKEYAEHITKESSPSPLPQLGNHLRDVYYSSPLPVVAEAYGSSSQSLHSEPMLQPWANMPRTEIITPQSHSTLVAAASSAGSIVMHPCNILSYDPERDGSPTRDHDDHHQFVNFPPPSPAAAAFDNLYHSVNFDNVHPHQDAYHQDTSVAEAYADNYLMHPDFKSASLQLEDNDEILLAAAATEYGASPSPYHTGSGNLSDDNTM